MAWFRCIGGNGGSGGSGGLKVIKYYDAAYRNGAPSTITTPTFTAEQGDLFIVAILSRGTYTLSGFTALDSQEFGGAGDTLKTFYKVSAGGTEQFSISISNRVRDEIAVFHLSGAENPSKVAGTYSNTSTRTMSFTIKGPRTIMLLATRYTSFDAPPTFEDMSIKGLSFYQNSDPSNNGAWVCGIINNETAEADISNTIRFSADNVYSYFTYSV